MPFLISSLLGGLLSLAGSLVGRVMLALGIGFIEYLGVKAMIDTVLASLGGALDGVIGSGYPLMIAWAGFFRLDVHIGIWISAVGMKALITGLASDRLKRLVRK